uniref:Uncharacterized protein n=1 Tax=Helianthus annuus TaxID=4232 RepID=A0A251U902_HELAN
MPLLSTYFSARFFPSLELVVVAQLPDLEYLVETHRLELKDLARYGTFSRCTSFQGHLRFKECDSFPGQVTVLKLCLCFVCWLNMIMVVRVYSR